MNAKIKKRFIESTTISLNELLEVEGRDHTDFLTQKAALRAISYTENPQSQPPHLSTNSANSLKAFYRINIIVKNSNEHDASVLLPAV